MTSIGIGNIKKFCAIMDAIRPLLPDISLVCDPETVTIREADLAKVCIIHFTLNSEGFESYAIPEEGITLGVGLKQMADMMRVVAKETNSLTLETDESGDKLIIQGSGEAHSQRKSHFTLNLKTLQPCSYEAPDEEYTSVITLSSSQFQELVCDLAPIGNYCKFTHKDQTLTFTVEGDSGKGSLECEVEDRTAEPTELCFAVKYIMQILPLLTLADTIQICMCREKPIMFQLDLDIPNTAVGDLRIYLAPRIVDD